jgi:hypothetical protein
MFTWMPVASDKYCMSFVVEGKTDKAEAEYSITGDVLISVAAGHTTVDKKLPADFCINEVEEGGNKIVNALGEFAGGFLRGFLD